MQARSLIHESIDGARRRDELLHRIVSDLLIGGCDQHIVGERQPLERLAVEVTLGLGALLRDQRVTLGGKGGWIEPKDGLGPAFEEPPPAVPGKARIARHPDQPPRRFAGAADIEQAVEHAWHRPRRSRAHRDEQRIATIAEAPAGRLFKKRHPLLQAVLERVLGATVALRDCGAKTDRQHEGWRNWDAGARHAGKNGGLGPDFLRRGQLG